MTIWTVSSAAQLSGALSSASAGDEILLASGNYGSFTFAGYKFNDYVTVRSADGGKEAVFSSIEIYNATYLRIDDVEVSHPSNPAAGSSQELVTVDGGSSHIQLVNSEVHGPVDSNYLGGRGIHTGAADDVLFENNFVHDIQRGGVFLGTTNLRVVGNKFEDLRDDSMKLAGVNGVVIEDNTGARRYHPQSGDHQDFIQFQGSSSNIVISGNVSLTEKGQSYQGIFLDDGVYKNVLIENNIIYNDLIRGISISAGSNITVVNNTVLTVPNSGHKASLIMLPSGSINKNNIMSSYEKVASLGDNIVAQYENPNGIAYYNDLFANAMKGLGVTLEDLRPVPGGPADFGTGMGAEQRLYELLYGDAGEPDSPPLNTIPIANDDYAVTSQGLSMIVDVLRNDYDADGDILTVSNISSASGVVFLNSDRTLTYTPALGFGGTDRITYTVSDGHGGTDTATVSISVSNPSSLVPVTAGLVAAYDAGMNVSLSTGNTVQGWLDGSGRGNDLTAAGNPTLLAGATPTGEAAIVFDGTGDLLQRVNASNTLNGLPAGSADRTIFVVIDYVNPEGVWSGVVYGDGAKNEAFGLVSDRNGQLSVQGWGSGNDFASGQNGVTGGFMVQSVVLSNNVTQHYKNGVMIDSDSHVYATDLQKLVLGAEIKGLGESQLKIAAVLIYDRAVSATERAQIENFLETKFITGPAAPVAGDDVAATPQDTPATIDVLANDSDANGDALAITNVSSPANGIAAIVNNGTPADTTDDQILYTPNSGFLGQDNFTYTVSDGHGGTDTATVSISIAQDLFI